ncbi:MAG: YfbK domain-containing protein [Ferruginibacter sp.]
MLLRNSEYKQNATYEDVIDLAKGAKGKDVNGYRNEFVDLVKIANNSAVAKK